ncbi:RIC1-like protein [Mya arenaria]|uniref:Protein RIC1 homolog n=1 Tax=Mya arenaria TaxID=6604 RepID=A0ABY7FSG1_MYAAR|nr:RIC1-like protein [Mya arenaria]
MMGKCGAQKIKYGPVFFLDKKKTTVSKEIPGPQEFPRNFLVPRNSKEFPGPKKFSGSSWSQEILRKFLRSWVRIRIRNESKHGCLTSSWQNNENTMYFPVGWPKYLKQNIQHSQEPCFIVSSCDRMLFAVLYDERISIWYCKTSKGYIALFKVDLDISVPNHHCLYVSTEGKTQVPRREINGIVEGDSIPAIKISLQSYVQLTAKLCLCIREELAVASVDGSVTRLRWNAQRNDKASFHLQEMPVASDFLRSSGTRLTEADGYVVQMEYSPIIGGYCMGTVGVWATDIKDVACLAVNHRYRLIAYGCKGSNGVVYTLNEVEGTLEATHRLQVTCKNFPEMDKTVGPVSCLKWTPDGTALAMTWRKGGFSLWSVFGSLLICTEWGLEGYHLWMIGTQDAAEEAGQYETVNRSDLIQLQFVKSCLTVNPCMTNHEHVFMQGEDKLYLNTGDITSKSSQYTGREAHILVGSKQWQIIPISHSYLAANWPIRYTCVDKAGQCVAVAGKTGLAHYALFTRKWKLFGNETQERDMVVSGGMAWWKDFLCVACYNIIGQRDEVRCYWRGSKLDNTFACTQKVPSQVLLLNIFKDTLLLFFVDSHLSKVQEVALNTYIPHPVCVTGVLLTSLKIDVAPVSCQLRSHGARDTESLLLNVAGKLLVFQRDRSGPQILEKDKHSPHKQKQLPFTSPSVVATNVENMWTTPRTNTCKLQLTEALWLGCGAHGMKVWLPLFPKNESQAHNFMSKRIMLPFRVDIYPLAVLFEEAVILGVSSDSLTFKSSAITPHSGTHLQHIPYCSLERTVYKPWNLLGAVQNWPTFPMCWNFYCMKYWKQKPLPSNPSQEFPEYLQTFVHCARKTEVALWPHLFKTVGNPKDLFENLEKPIASRQHATLLLDSAVESNQWDLAQDIVRFLKSIDPSDNDASPPLAFNMMSPTTYTSTPAMEQDHFTFSSVSNVSRIRSSSVTAESMVREANKESGKKKLSHTLSDNQFNAKKSPSSKQVSIEGSTDQVYIDSILCRHARKLLSSNRIRDLGYFAANIRDFGFVSWLRKERLRTAKVTDFVCAIRDLHHQFHWPLPVLSLLASLTLLDDNAPLSPGFSRQNATLVPKPSPGPGGSQNNLYKVDSFISNGVSDEIILKPQLLRTEDSSLATQEISDSSSQFGDFDVLGDSTSSLDSLSPELELLSQEIISKGPEQSELELRYMFQVLLEAECLEWALLVAIVLRDSLAVVRTVNTASMTDTPLEPFLHAIRGQIHILSKITETAPPTLKLSTDMDSSNCSVEEGNLSPSAMTMRGENDTPHDLPSQTVDPPKQSECADEIIF